MWTLANKPNERKKSRPLGYWPNQGLFITPCFHYFLLLFHLAIQHSDTTFRLCVWCRRKEMKKMCMKTRNDLAECSVSRKKDSFRESSGEVSIGDHDIVLWSLQPDQHHRTNVSWIRAVYVSLLMKFLYGYRRSAINFLAHVCIY